MNNKGLAYVAASYGLWGFFPLYFKLLRTVNPFQTTAHRIIWSFVFLVGLVALRGELPGLRKAFKPRTLLLYLCSGMLLAVNWSTYVWAVNSGYVVEGSLGYFINPLLSVLMGVIFFREKLRPLQWLPVGISAVGVIYLTANYGRLPWVALSLAVTFGLYGVIKKIAPLDSLPGLVLETGMIFLPALGFIFYEETQGLGSFGHTGIWTALLLILGGVVTTVPLMFFASGARQVPLIMVGLLQYIAPTLQFLIGVFVFGETFSTSSLIGFTIIWAALIIFSLENFLVLRRRMKAQAAAAP